MCVGGQLAAQERLHSILGCGEVGGRHGVVARFAPWHMLGPHASLASQVHYILQEVVIGGMVLETSMNEIVAQAEAQSKLEKAEVSSSLERVLRCGRRAGWALGAMKKTACCRLWGRG